MKNLLALIFLSLLIFSCSDDTSTDMMDPEMMEPQETILLLKERTQDGMLESTYMYNTDSTLSNSISYVNNEPTWENRYTYIGDNITSERIQIETNQVTALRKYSKLSDTESLREFFNADNELQYSSTYFFDGNECGYTDILVFDALGNSLPSTRVEFTDDNCSSLFYSKYGDDDEYIQWEYTRSDKFSASNSTILPFFGVKKQRSVTKLVRRSSGATVSTNLSYDAVFEYNDDDHPTQETRTYLDGDVIEYTYEYY